MWVDGFFSITTDPTKRTGNLSADVYEVTTVSSAVVAAQQADHIFQHAKT
jgi:Zn-dependent membrane protease YugP